MDWFKHVSILAVALTLEWLVPFPVHGQAKPQASSLSRQLENSFSPPPTEPATPTNTAHGGTRHDDSCIEGNQPLTALVPASGTGKTIAKYPTIFWYMPQTSASTVEFVLQDTNGDDLYRIQYRLARSITGGVGASSVMSLTLPTLANLAPLEVDQDYQWKLALVCNPLNRSEDVIVQGKIKRVASDANLERRLQQATPQERVAIYADAQLWYETLLSLVELRRAYPNDNTLANDWNTLLSLVGLEGTLDETRN